MPQYPAPGRRFCSMINIRIPENPENTGQNKDLPYYRK
jgi:hypothetical protein